MPVRAIDLQDPLTAGQQLAGHSGAVAAGALHRPRLDRPPRRAPPLQLFDPAAGSGEPQLTQTSTVAVQRHGDVEVLVGIHPDHDVVVHRHGHHTGHELSSRQAALPRVGSAGQHWDGASRPGSYQVTSGRHVDRQERRSAAGRQVGKQAHHGPRKRESDLPPNDTPHHPSGNACTADHHKSLPPRPPAATDARGAWRQCCWKEGGR